MKEQKCKTSEVRVIRDIQFGKDGVHVLLGKEEKVLDSGSYAEMYLYPGKELSDEEYRRLCEFDTWRKAIRYVTALLCSRRYTYHQAYRKVKEKFRLPDDSVRKLLDPYVLDGMLDDRIYVRDYIEEMVSNGFWFSFCIKKLKMKGIDEKTISEVIESLKEDDRYDEEVQKEKIYDLIHNAERKCRNVPFRKRKQEILKTVIQRGFDPTLSAEMVNGYFDGLSKEERLRYEENDQALLKNKLKECYNSLRNKELSPKERKAKILQKMLSKGFSYDDVVEEMNKEGTDDDQGFN